tara:strand:+ start:232 stop:387 length:156 start_codon:yes stop_codon:yes gene_type:complete
MAVNNHGQLFAIKNLSPVVETDLMMAIKPPDKKVTKCIRKKKSITQLFKPH